MNIGVRLIQVAVVYMMTGLIMGMGMAIRKDFTLSSVHAHISLLGWATMAIAGIVYILVPKCAGNRLAKLHFWGHNIGLPVMLVSLTLYLLGISSAQKAIAVGSILVVGSLLLFSVNLILNGRLNPPR